jgi:hypothetical protein
MLIFLGFDRSAGGSGPCCSPTTGHGQANPGPLFPATSVWSHATGEGWYFSGPSQQSLRLSRGHFKLRRVRVISHQFERTPRWRRQTPQRLPVEHGAHFRAALSDDDSTHRPPCRTSPPLTTLVQCYKNRNSSSAAPPKGFELDECRVDNPESVARVNPNGSVQNRIVDLRRHDHDHRRSQRIARSSRHGLWLRGWRRHNPRRTRRFC